MKKLHENLNELSDEDLLHLIFTTRSNIYSGELYKRYVHLVYSVCRKYLKDKTSSKDLAMSVFERFLKKPPAANTASFKKWLLTVTKHECLTFLRNKSRIASQHEKWENFEKKSEIFMEKEVVWSLNSRETIDQKIENALSQLKSPQMTCIQLFYLEGKSYKEIEEHTNFNLNQIKSYIQNGKRKLKMLLEHNSES